MGTEAVGAARPGETNDARRRPWVAALLTLIALPLGHVYAGRAARGYALLALSGASAAAAAYIALSFRPTLLAFAVALIAAVGLYPVVDAFRSARKAPSPYPLKRSNRLWIYVLVVVSSWILSETAATVVRTYFVQALQNPASSMEPTLLIGDHFLIDKRSFMPARGDVVVLEYPEDPTKMFIKRVIGLPGETVEIRAKKVFINGEPLDEPYAQHSDDGAMRSRRDQLPPQTLSTGDYFVLGDNRDRSYDSRFWGPIRADTVLGKARLIYFSWGERGLLWDRIGKPIE